ncbi:hypothetical protein CYPRO_0862 [Cyclonatronum proteinivorum]|uniref:Uncharacterized protein n=1 Tax=Cyclonatronum proteinivorum TaxID=1457365 RepID=A0A345UI37_9BACT|nr:hypothetical protein [Cyclonatronum proteinivorum]AXJ00139.1 hypothetical protein CYPRO_0862 [Cyclonatronum proteinivorum]
MSALRFQLTIDTDTVLISQSPAGKKSRVSLTNLDQSSVEQLVRGIEDAGLTETILAQLATNSNSNAVNASSETETRLLNYTVYLGLSGEDSKSTPEQSEKTTEKISSILNDIPEIDGFTISRATGNYRGDTEDVWLIHLAVEHPDISRKCARAIKKSFGQRAVGLTLNGLYARLQDL